MSKNQENTDVFSQLAAQIQRLANGGNSTLDVRWTDTGIDILQENRHLQHFASPVKTGTILNFIHRHLNKSDLEALPDTLIIGPYALDPRLSSLTHVKTGDVIYLTDKERDILAALWRAPDKSLGRDDLLAAVWAYVEGVETHTLETHIYRLRQKIEADPAIPALLVNNDGAYRLNA